MFGFSREAIRVKVKKCEGSLPTEFRKFSVDPQITSFEVLQSILAKAFDLKGDFAICYRIVDGFGNETYMPLLSDWDLDAAFLKAQNLSLITKNEPCLCLRVDLKPFEECSDDWEVRQAVSTHSPAKPLVPFQEIKQPPARLHGIFNQVGKTINLMQRAFNLGEDGGSHSIIQYPPKAPLSDAEFRKYLDPVGQIINAKELRSCIYFGGIEPSLRKVVWKHLLNVYPKGMTGKERMDYIKKKASEYYTLKEIWKSAIAQGPVDGELAYTTGMVKKDVLRTDRHHEFYAGNDDNQNIASLFNILTTYALNHPKVSYCQGMSDLASPLLVTMNDEAHAYICFCALMKRLSSNFMIDGIAMTQKFTHLSEAIMYYDPEFYNYLKIHQADDLLFCYRWLLLEMKREFAFEDSLRMLEVLWSSLPADPPIVELKLFDVKFQPTPLTTPPISPLVKTPRENAYTKVCALRRRSSSISLNTFNNNKKKLDKSKRLNHSLDEMMIKKNILGDTKQQNSVEDEKTGDSSPTLSSSPKTPTTTTSADMNGDNLDLENKLEDTTTSTVDLETPIKLVKSELKTRSVSTSSESKSDTSTIALNNHVNNNNNNKVGNKVRSSSLSSSMTNLMKNKKGNHFRELKEKIISSKIFSSLEQLDGAHAGAVVAKDDETGVKSTGKMIKNFNEFLNFASANKNKILKLGANAAAATAARDANGADINPKITLTRSSVDDSETSSTDRNFSKSCSGDDTFDDYSPDDQEYFPLTTSVTRELRLEMDNLDRRVFGEHFNCDRSVDSSTSGSDSSSSVHYKSDNEKDEVDHAKNQDESKMTELTNTKKCDDSIFVWENPLHQTSPGNNQQMPSYVAAMPQQQQQNSTTTSLEISTEIPSIVNETSASKTVTPIRIINYTQAPTCTMTSEKNKALPNVEADSVREPSSLSDNIDNNAIVKMNGGGGGGGCSSSSAAAVTDMTNSCEEVTESARGSALPPPDEFGGGNPFLMFLCITVLLQHRDHVIQKGMDYNEMAMHFDKMIRRHNVVSVLNQARQMYGSYMKQQSLLLRHHHRT